MNDSQVAFLLKYSSPYEMLVITGNNKLVELKCPFEVRVKKCISDLKINEVKFVSKIQLSTNMKLVYIIDEISYFYYHFDIIL